MCGDGGGGGKRKESRKGKRKPYALSSLPLPGLSVSTPAARTSPFQVAARQSCPSIESKDSASSMLNAVTLTTAAQDTL
jgi:hypothetical protein